MKGTILWYCERDKNGIILGEDNKEYYFDSSVWKTKTIEPARKYLVVFDISDKINDCLCAREVKAELLA